jgi:histidyl-tRNA synthetase
MNLSQCASCGEVYPTEEMIAYWPVDDEEDRKYVCRPDITSTCFRAVVKDTSIHAIGKGV